MIAPQVISSTAYDTHLPVSAFHTIRSMGGIHHDVAAELTSDGSPRGLQGIVRAKHITGFSSCVLTFIHHYHAFHCARLVQLFQRTLIWPHPRHELDDLLKLVFRVLAAKTLRDGFLSGRA